jgi:hypothetical protein
MEQVIELFVIGVGAFYDLVQRPLGGALRRVKLGGGRDSGECTPGQGEKDGADNRTDVPLHVTVSARARRFGRRSPDPR